MVRSRTNSQPTMPSLSMLSVSDVSDATPLMANKVTRPKNIRIPSRRSSLSKPSPSLDKTSNPPSQSVEEKRNMGRNRKKPACSQASRQHSRNSSSKLSTLLDKTSNHLTHSADEKRNKGNCKQFASSHVSCLNRHQSRNSSTNPSPSLDKTSNHSTQSIEEKRNEGRNLKKSASSQVSYLNRQQSRNSAPVNIHHEIGLCGAPQATTIDQLYAESFLLPENLPPPSLSSYNKEEEHLKHAIALSLEESRSDLASKSTRNRYAEAAATTTAPKSDSKMKNSPKSERFQCRDEKLQKQRVRGHSTKEKRRNSLPRDMKCGNVPAKRVPRKQEEGSHSSTREKPKALNVPVVRRRHSIHVDKRFDSNSKTRTFKEDEGLKKGRGEYRVGSKSSRQYRTIQIPKESRSCLKGHRSSSDSALVTDIEKARTNNEMANNYEWRKTVIITETEYHNPSQDGLSSNNGKNPSSFIKTTKVVRMSARSKYSNQPISYPAINHRSDEPNYYPVVRLGDEKRGWNVHGAA